MLFEDLTEATALLIPAGHPTAEKGCIDHDIRIQALIDRIIPAALLGIDKCSRNRNSSAWWKSHDHLVGTLSACRILDNHCSRVSQPCGALSPDLMGLARALRGNNHTEVATYPNPHCAVHGSSPSKCCDHESTASFPPPAVISLTEAPFRPERRPHRRHDDARANRRRTEARARMEAEMTRALLGLGLLGLTVMGVLRRKPEHDHRLTMIDAHETMRNINDLSTCLHPCKISRLGTS